MITDANRVSTVSDLSRDIEMTSVAKYDPDNLNPSAQSLVLTRSGNKHASTKKSFSPELPPNRS
jgi:hypothetical protein